MKYLVTGVTGQLGAEIALQLLNSNPNIEVYGLGRKNAPLELKRYLNFFEHKCDITDFGYLEKLFLEIMPDVVIHCAAWTNVEAAEKQENHAEVINTNVCSTAILAKLCNEYNKKLLYISTDFVFGNNHAFYEDLNPLNFYGETKRAGERIIENYTNSKFFIVRVGWTFGKYGKNFVSKIIELANYLPVINVVYDEIGTPTYAEDAAAEIINIVNSDKYGTYNLSESGNSISRAQFAKVILNTIKELGFKNDTVISPVSSEQLIYLAKRPKYSVMDISNLVANGFNPLPKWQIGLKKYLQMELSK